MLKSQTLTQIRCVTMGAAGCVALIYVVFSLGGYAAPTTGWFVFAASLGTAVVIFVTTLLAKPGDQAASLDERYQAKNAQAERIAYWAAVAIYLIFGALIAQDALTAAEAIGPMAGLTGAAYLLPYAVLTWARA